MFVLVDNLQDPCCAVQLTGHQPFGFKAADPSHHFTPAVPFRANGAQAELFSVMHQQALWVRLASQSMHCVSGIYMNECHLSSPSCHTCAPAVHTIIHPNAPHAA